jgi:predicted RNase H-like nuclease (RuvC/YqgF family)
MLLTTLSVGCSTLRSDMCATVHTVMLEELRITEETPRHVSEPVACERHGMRLRKLSADLAALEIRDKSLRKAVESYRAEMERLSEEYARLARAYRSVPEENSEDEEERVREMLGPLVVDRAASVNGPRTRLRDVCNGF